jgi:hypothetical protein
MRLCMTIMQMIELRQCACAFVRRMSEFDQA